MLNRRQAAFAIAALSHTAFAADWPSKPIRVVVPFGAGGIADLTARAVGDALSQRIGQPVIIDNRPGAGGVTAGEFVAHAAPDGYTLLLLSNGTAVSAGLFNHLPFDAQKDFAPVSLIGEFDLGIVVPASSPFRTLQDFVKAAHDKPGKLNIATVAVGSTQNLAAELFKTKEGIAAQVVPFNGTPAVIAALGGGQVDAAIEILGPVKPHVTSGRLRVLSTMKQYDVSSWNGLAAPAKTPPAVIDKLNREVNAVLAMPALKDKLAALEVQARGSTPQQLGALLDKETKRWSEVIARAGIPKQ
ncbi:MAG TPA: tripartite tricarboxylate transporter substrate-binding protein [Ramlibacter sp.]|nr:tripartite tricarboxylate transporter substrate-binding protein [Ramlibacter sp.]